MEKENTRQIKINSISPVIDVSIDMYSDTVYLLGRYNPVSGNSNVYSLPIGSELPTLVTSTQAIELESLNKSMLLLYQSAEAEDASEISLFDMNKKSIISTRVVNKYSVSKDRSKVYFQNTKEQGIISLNAPLLIYIKAKPYLEPAWKDNDSLLLIDNLTQPPSLYYVDANNGEITEPFKLSGIPRVLWHIEGTTQDEIVFTTKDGDYILTPIP